MREEIAKIVWEYTRRSIERSFEQVGFDIMWQHNDLFELPEKDIKEVAAIADAILAIPVGNATLGEVIGMVPGIVSVAKMYDVQDPDSDHVLADELLKALTLKSGELLEIKQDEGGKSE